MSCWIFVVSNILESSCIWEEYWYLKVLKSNFIVLRIYRWNVLKCWPVIMTYNMCSDRETYTCLKNNVKTSIWISTLSVKCNTNLFCFCGITYQPWIRHASIQVLVISAYVDARSRKSRAVSVMSKTYYTLFILFCWLNCIPCYSFIWCKYINIY